MQHRTRYAGESLPILYGEGDWAAEELWCVLCHRDLFLSLSLLPGIASKKGLTENLPPKRKEVHLSVTLPPDPLPPDPLPFYTYPLSIVHSDRTSDQPSRWRIEAEAEGDSPMYMHSMRTHSRMSSEETSSYSSKSVDSVPPFPSSLT